MASKTLEALKAKFGERLDAVSFSLTVIDNAGTEFPLTLFEMPQRDAISFVTEAYGNDPVLRDEQGVIVFELGRDGKPLMDGQNRPIPKYRPFAEVAEKASAAIVKGLVSSVRDKKNQNEKFFFDLLGKISSAQVIALAEILFALNCVEEMVDARGNLTALPIYRAMERRVEEAEAEEATRSGLESPSLPATTS